MRAAPTSTSMSSTNSPREGLAGQDLNFSQILRQNRCTSGSQLVYESSGEVFQVPHKFEFLRRSYGSGGTVRNNECGSVIASDSFGTSERDFLCFGARISGISGNSVRNYQPRYHIGYHLTYHTHHVIYRSSWSFFFCFVTISYIIA